MPMDDDRCRQMAERVRAVEESAKSAHKRLDTMEGQLKALNSLATSVATISNELSHVKESLESIDARLDLIEQKPAARWESIVSQIIGLVVAAAAGYFLSRIFK